VVVASAASRKSGQRRCERGHTYGVVGPAAGLRGRPAVSHISRKTSEMWGTRPWCGDRAQKAVVGEDLRVLLPGTHTHPKALNNIGERETVKPAPTD
jgi:hypothetical protein